MMSLPVLIAACLVLGRQGSPPEQMEALLEKLGSLRIEEREEASRSLKALRKKALPALDKLAKSADPEVSGRSVRLAGVIRILEDLPQAVVTAMEGVEERIFDQGPSGWAKVFLEAVRWEEERSIHPTLRRSDFAMLAPKALTCTEANDIDSVCAAIVRWTLTESIPALIELLDHGNEQIVVHAVRTLGYLHAWEAVPAIGKILNDPKKTADDLSKAILVLADLGAKEYLPQIRAFLGSQHDQVQDDALRALIVLGEKGDVVKDVRPFLLTRGRANPFVVEFLMGAGDREAIPSLLKVLETHPGPPRSNVFEALALLGAPQAVPGFRTLLKIGDYNDQSTALWGLGHLAAAQAVDDIIPFLYQEDEYHQRLAIEAIVRIKPPRAARKIFHLLKTGKSFPREELLRAIGDLGATDLRDDLLKFAEENPKDIPAIIEALGKMGSKEDIPKIVAWMKSHIDAVSAAVDALGRLDAREAVPEIRNLTVHDPGLRLRVALVLKDLGDADVCVRLRDFLDEEDRWVGATAAWALYKIQDKKAVEKCVDHLRGGTAGERLRAIANLGRMGARSEIPRIVPFLKGLDQSERVTAAVWLCHLGSKEGVPVLLEEAQYLSILNALREPEVWHNLRWKFPSLGMPASPPSQKDLIGAWAETVRLKLNWCSASEGEWEAVGFMSCCLFSWGIPPGMIECSLYDGRFSAILEKDQVRVVPTRTALEFWETWWKSVQKNDLEGKREK